MLMDIQYATVLQLSTLTTHSFKTSFAVFTSFNVATFAGSLVCTNNNIYGQFLQGSKFANTPKLGLCLCPSTKILGWFPKSHADRRTTMIYDLSNTCDTVYNIFLSFKECSFPRCSTCLIHKLFRILQMIRTASVWHSICILLLFISRKKSLKILYIFPIRPPIFL